MDIVEKEANGSGTRSTLFEGRVKTIHGEEVFTKEWAKKLALAINAGDYDAIDHQLSERGS